MVKRDTGSSVVDADLVAGSRLVWIVDSIAVEDRREKLMLYNDKQYRIEARRGDTVVKFRWVSAGSSEEACRLLKQDMVASGWFSDAEELDYVWTGEAQ